MFLFFSNLLSLLIDLTSRTSFVSTGADGSIRLWNLDGGDNDDGHDIWFNQRLHTFYATPHDLAFKPDTSILAIAEK
jgi:WD40 repeat protein